MTGHIGRREFITLLGSTAAWPFAAHARHSERMRRIGVLMGLVANDPEAQSRAAIFENGLQELGWVKGRNLSIEYRWAGDGNGLRDHVAELLAMEPDLILANTTPVTAALQKQSRTVPIVFAQVGDPVGQGLVPNLAHPGGNLTGSTSFEFSIGTKWLGHARLAHVQSTERAVRRPVPRSGRSGGAESLSGVDQSCRVRPCGCRSYVRRACARTKWGSDCAAGYQHDELSRGDRRAGGAPPHTCDLPVSLLCYERWSDVLRHRPGRGVMARSYLCRPHPQRRKARGFAGASPD